MSGTCWARHLNRCPWSFERRRESNDRRPYAADAPAPCASISTTATAYPRYMSGQMAAGCSQCCHRSYSHLLQPASDSAS